MTLEVKRAPTCRGVCRLGGKPIRKGALRVDFRAHSFRSVLQELATRCRNTCRVQGNLRSRLVLHTEPTPFQTRVFELLRL